MILKSFGRLTFGPKTNVLGMKKVYEPPNPKSLMYSHDCEPLNKVNLVLIIRKENIAKKL